MRATTSTSIVGAKAARRLNGIEASDPSRSMSLRPYRSPRAPR